MDIISPDDVVQECTMGQNFILEYGGFTPAQALMGHNPRGLYETETNSVVAHSGAKESSPDYFEAYLRGRMIAKASIQQAIIEARIALANNSKPVKLDLSKLTPLETSVDLYRVPDKKDQSGWRGPCDLLDISRQDNQAFVKYESTPFIIPLR